MVHYDVVVYDATPGGIAAAIAAAREGMSVLVFTEDRHVGGMQTSGLGNTNTGHTGTIGGLCREFHERIQRYYTERYGLGSTQVQECCQGFYFEPHVALEVYNTWLSEAGVTVLTDEGLKSAEVMDGRIASILTEKGRTVTADIFIDGSYEGDLFKASGCSYHVGRESRDVYGESLAGVRYPSTRLGEGDLAIQAYDYRLCLTNVEHNRVPFEKPIDYDRSNYDYHAYMIRKNQPTSLRQVLPLNLMPNQKTDSRTGEWVGGSWEYPEATAEERRSIEWAHRQYSGGYLWFLLTDPVVPSGIRNQLREWGLAKDEFVDNDHWPYHIYVREARRLVGDFVLTQSDVTDDRFKVDSVALGNFFLDVHPVQMVPAEDGSERLVPEGGFGIYHTKPYEIPYRALLPKRSEIANLLVPVCLSASHVAFSTIRMEPVYMMLGHAAGLAAALAKTSRVAVQDVETAILQKRLVEQGQILDARPFNEPITKFRPSDWIA